MTFGYEIYQLKFLPCFLMFSNSIFAVCGEVEERRTFSKGSLCNLLVFQEMTYSGASCVLMYSSPHWKYGVPKGLVGLLGRGAGVPMTLWENTLIDIMFYPRQLLQSGELCSHKNQVCFLGTSFRFFAIIGYYRILNIVCCAMW